MAEPPHDPLNPQGADQEIAENEGDAEESGVEEVHLVTLNAVKGASAGSCSLRFAQGDT